MKNRLNATPATARWCLFGDTDAVAAIEQSLGRRRVRRSLADVVGGLGDAGQSAVSHQAAKAADELLDIDLADVVFGGLRASTELRNAARCTFVDGGRSEVVIATYRFACAHRPSVALLVDGVELARIHFSLDLTVTIDGLAATIEHGELIALGGDRCKVKASLAVHGKEIAERSVDIPITAVCTLRDPIPLLTERERLTLVPPAGRAVA